MGRPSRAPGISCRALLGISQASIASAASLGGLPIRWASATFWSRVRRAPPDHSTLSRTRRLRAVETREPVFGFVLRVVTSPCALHVLQGRTFGVDATTRKANAAMRGIVGRDTGDNVRESLTEAEKAHVECRLGAPAKPGCADYEEERRVHAHGPQCGACGGFGDGRHSGCDAAGCEPGRTTTMRETVAEAGRRMAETAAAVNSEADEHGGSAGGVGGGECGWWEPAAGARTAGHAAAVNAGRVQGYAADELTRAGGHPEAGPDSRERVRSELVVAGHVPDKNANICAWIDTLRVCFRREIFCHRKTGGVWRGQVLFRLQANTAGFWRGDIGKRPIAPRAG
jgi:hypothetical protein